MLLVRHAQLMPQVSATGKFIPYGNIIIIHVMSGLAFSTSLGIVCLLIDSVHSP